MSDSCATQCTVAHQAPLSVEFPRQEYCKGWLFPSLGIFLTQGSNPHLLHWQVDSLPLRHLGSSYDTLITYSSLGPAGKLVYKMSILLVPIKEVLWWARRQDLFLKSQNYKPHTERNYTQWKATLMCKASWGQRVLSPTARVGKPQPIGQVTPAVSVNKVLLEHSHVHSFPYCPRLLQHCSMELRSYKR